MKYRLVVDLRQVNTHLRQYSLCYKRLRDFGHLLQRRDWMVGFDLKNAYHHLRIHDKDQHYLQFRIEGELFQCVALPFGLALSPHHFTHLILPIIRFYGSLHGVPEDLRLFNRDGLPAIRHWRNTLANMPVGSRWRSWPTSTTSSRPDSAEPKSKNGQQRQGRYSTPSVSNSKKQNANGIRSRRNGIWELLSIRSEPFF